MQLSLDDTDTCKVKMQYTLPGTANIKEQLNSS